MLCIEVSLPSVLIFLIVSDIIANINEVGHIKAHQFVGQNDSGDHEGMDQREQSRVMELFKAGNFNVLVATSVAEEGLDIGPVDLCVFFESVASPTRLLQVNTNASSHQIFYPPGS